MRRSAVFSARTWWKIQTSSFRKLSMIIDPYEDYSILYKSGKCDSGQILSTGRLSRLPCRDYRRRCRVVYARGSTACSNKAPQNVNVSPVIFHTCTLCKVSNIKNWIHPNFHMNAALLHFVFHFCMF